MVVSKIRLPLKVPKLFQGLNATPKYGQQHQQPKTWQQKTIQQGKP